MSEFLGRFETALPDGVKMMEDISHLSGAGESSFVRCGLTVDKKKFPVVMGFKEIHEVSDFRNTAFVLRQEAAKLDCLPMIALRYIGPVLRRVAKEEKINFLDMAGNFYFRHRVVHN
jgi:hypothetical protein